jgi:hypothetical protein
MYSLKDHPEHEARLGEWRDKWIAIALRTTPQSPAEREQCRGAILGMYASAELEPPLHVVFTPSPVSGAIAATIAACAWWLRENPDIHARLFGRRVVEAEIMGAIHLAASVAVRAGMGLAAAPAVDAVDAATDAATFAATDAATEAATDAAIVDATVAATSTATSAAISAATRAAANTATVAATVTATNTATFAATRAAIVAAISTATDAATRAATDTATDGAISAATVAAIRDATFAATNTATVAAAAVARFYIAAMERWASMLNGGNMWAGWCSYLSFFRHVAGLDLPQYARWDDYETAATMSGYRYMHSRFCIVADFPTVIGRDETGRPHCAGGPSIAWADGWAGHYWRGVKVPREWIESPHSIDPRLALTHENAELRRCAAEIVGWDRIISTLPATTIDLDPDPEIGELVEVVIDGESERFLRVRCGTGRQFALPVPPDMRSALEANAWTYGIDTAALRELEVRT